MLFRSAGNAVRRQHAAIALSAMAASGLILSISSPVSAATFKALHDFYPYPDGATASTGLTPGTDGALYGECRSGGAFGNGTFFKVTPAKSFKVLHSFSLAEGQPDETAPVQAPDGKFYGITSSTGPLSPNALYSIAASGAFQKVHTFGSGDGVKFAFGKLASAGNYIYGTAGTGYDDFIYRSSLSGVITILHKLDQAKEGASPNGLIYGPGGAFYTACNMGGPKGGGTIIKISAAGAVTVLHAFAPLELGLFPVPLAAGPDGNLWGVFDSSGSGLADSIYKITPSGNFTAVVNAVSDFGTLIANPLVAKGDSLYGEVIVNNGGAGKVFKVTTQGVVSTVYSFDGQPAGGPTGGLAVGKDGGLYGTSTYLAPLAVPGQTAVASTAFKLTDTGTFTLLHTMPITDGRVAIPSVTVTADGIVYGVTEYGGKYDQGMLYKMSNAGVMTDIYDFGTEDSTPLDLIQGLDGNLYGLTSRTIFKAVPGAKPTTIYHFGSSTFPFGRLTAGANHWIYGLSYGSGTPAQVYRINASGSFAKVGAFPSAADAEEVTLAADGSVYGVSQYGPSGNGAIFKFTKAGAFSYVYSFPSNSSPLQSLTPGFGGRLFYGVSRGDNQGIFAFNPATSQAAFVHRFNGSTEGVIGTSALTLGADGTLYGTTSNNLGASALYGFSPISGQFNVLGKMPAYVDLGYFNTTPSPSISLTFSPSGKIYGVAPFGGAHNGGQVFQFLWDSAPPPV